MWPVIFNDIQILRLVLTTEFTAEGALVTEVTDVYPISFLWNTLITVVALEWDKSTTFG